MATTALFFDVFGRDKGAGEMLDKLGGKAQSTGTKMGGIGDNLKRVAVPAVSAGIGAMVVQFGQAAATAEQSAGAVENVFGSAAAQVESFAARSASAVGLSGQQYNELSAITGTALKAAGVSVDELAGKNDELITRGADMASVFGGSTAEAVRAMGSAFRGEFDPLERYGVQLSAAKVSAELAARGQDQLGGAALEAAKKQATLDLIMKESTNSAGNFAKEANTATGQQERQTAAFGDAAAKLGQVLLPAMTKLSEVLAVAAKWVGDNAGLMTALVVVLGVLGGGVLAVNAASAAFAAVSGVVRGATMAWTAAQWLLNLSIGGFPVLLIVAAIAALVGSVVWAYNNVGWFRDGVDRAFSSVRGIVDGVSRFFTDVVAPAFGRGLQGVREGFDGAVNFIRTTWERLREIAAAPVRFVVNTIINDGLIGGLNGLLPDGMKIGRINLGFKGGGYTGDGGKDDPAGIVHGGEWVFTKEETARAGVPMLRRLARVLRGYAGGGLVHPVPGAVVSQPYHAGHNGIDFAAPTGTPVRAAGMGFVSSAGWSPFGGGNEVHLRHLFGGIETWYAHLSRILVGNGQFVADGAHVGEVGSTGNSTGPHLHFMVLNGGWPNHTDPGPMIGGGAFNPIGALIDGIVGGLRTPAGGIFADLAMGLARKVLDNAAGFVGGMLGIGAAGGPTTFDGGGWLRNVGSTQLVNHRSSLPDAVLTSQQWDDIHTLALGERTITGTLVLDNGEVLGKFRGIARTEADAAVDRANQDLLRGRAR